MRNVVSSRLKEKYEFIPFTTSRPAKRNAKSDNYGYGAIFLGGPKRVAQGIAITLWHLSIYPFIVLTRRPSVIQIQASDFQAFWEAALYIVMAKALRRPVVLRIGGSFDRFFESSGAFARSAVRWVLRQPTLLVVQSLYWREHIARLGRAEGVVVLNNFVPENLIVRRNERRPASPRFLLCCTEVPQLKGAYVVLEALRMLAARQIRVEVTLMAVPASLRQQIEAEGLERSVTMLDFLSHEEALEALRRTDVLLQISSSEGFPNMLLEAMAVGCAAIVTPVGAIPEVVGRDGESAFIIPIGDAAMLAERMGKLARDRDMLARMAAAAQDRVLDRFTEAKVIAVLGRAYELAMRLRKPALLNGARDAEGTLF
jgi:glycosyltransferase involved in cell wall biosynthesis